MLTQTVLFSPMQQAVLTGIAACKAHKTIADELNLSIRTVQAYSLAAHRRVRTLAGDPHFNSVHLLHVLLRLGLVPQLYDKLDVQGFRQKLERAPQRLRVGILVALGKSKSVISKELSCPKGTVRAHVSTLYMMCSALTHDQHFGRMHLVHLLLKLGLIDLLYPNARTFEDMFVRKREESVRKRKESRIPHQPWGPVQLTFMSHFLKVLKVPRAAKLTGLKPRSGSVLKVKVYHHLGEKLGIEHFRRSDLMRVFPRGKETSIEEIRRKLESPTNTPQTQQ